MRRIDNKKMRRSVSRPNNQITMYSRDIKHAEYKNNIERNYRKITMIRINKNESRSNSSTVFNCKTTIPNSEIIKITFSEGLYSTGKLQLCMTKSYFPIMTQESKSVNCNCIRV